MTVVDWAVFETERPDLALHARARLMRTVSYLSTVRPDGFPRVHPVGVHIREGRLLVPMLPTSPKRRDLTTNGRFAVHCAVEDNSGGGGEVLVTGLATEAPAIDEFADRGWITFHLRITEVLLVQHPEGSDKPRAERWRAAV